MRGKKLSINELKSNLVGKVFGWLTVLDIVVDDKDHLTKCLCKCKCGNNKLVLPCHILNNKVTSCGCYIKSNEYSKNRKQFYKDHPDKLIERSGRLKQYYEDHPEAIELASKKSKEWAINNPDKVKEIGRKHSQFYIDHPEEREKVGKITSQWAKENPDKIREKAERYSQWCKDNPDKVKERVDKFKQWCANNKDRLYEIGKKISQWYKNNPEKVKEKSEKFSKWCVEHPEVTKRWGERFSEWAKNNPDKIAEKTNNRRRTIESSPAIQESISLKRSLWYKENHDRVSEISSRISNTFKFKRVESDFDKLLDIIHPDYIKPLLKGDLTSISEILTKCPICGEYDYHALHNVFRITHNDLKFGNGRLCKRCVGNLSKSSYEVLIKNFITTFYSGICVENDRSILSPLELDLYYPKKKIAIEFNGDYWHDENHKPVDYHYNKFRQCYDRGIILVSIFESEWNNNNKNIEKYLVDLFDDKVNGLSIVDSLYMNNNYPSFNINISNELVEHYYYVGSNKVYTCGYTKIKQ